MNDKIKSYEVNAIILASGHSNRFKGNKLKAEISEKKIYSYVLDLIESIPFKDKIVVTNDSEIIEYAVKREINYEKNLNANLGKSESIKLGIKNSKINSKGYMFFMADQPFLKEKSVVKLLSEFEKNPDKIILPRFAGKKGSPVIMPISLKEKLLELKGEEGGSIFITEKNSISVEIESEIEGKDIDSLEDYNSILNYFDGKN
ncbi:nucleotidyltransferase family protein [Peptoniphilus sp. AGMB00490]|uniref:Nucleotidyltransferase family protein n=1 Tax=Peptoniphilus faecalis TaxID=2731255 RepID=A0A848RFK3_9FIRM|nr:nucleotidyltransferase family protein [Peptoniphilus faecalis]NMW85600.1 nucleotidyltransferase family protein [Peptoniphilus faecalis]